MLHLGRAQLSILFFSLCVLTDRAGACYSRPYFNSKRAAGEHVFISEENQPRDPETVLTASGPLYYSDLVYDSRKLVRLTPTKFLEVRAIYPYVTESCRRRIKELAYFVNHQWGNGIRLRVINAWRPPRISQRSRRTWQYIRYSNNGLLSTMVKSQLDFHSAGRAVDFTVNRPERIPLGKLAMLAYYRAHFDWCRYQRGRVHCSVKSASREQTNSFACFPGTARVLTQAGARVPMATLVPGTRVLAMDAASGRLDFSPVETFLHRQPLSVVPFVRLLTAGNRSVTLTGSHLIFRLHRNATVWDSVYAKDVRPGDRLLFADRPGASAQPVEVTDRREIVSRGFYAPYTPLGTIVVDDHVASCFAHVNSHRLASWAMQPFRLLVRWAGAEDSSAGQGLHWYPSLLYAVAQRLLPTSLLYAG